MELKGENRNQFQMVRLESCVADESYARVVDAFVDYLPIEQLSFFAKGAKHNGRPVYPVASLLKLYFYGYLNRVRSLEHILSPVAPIL